MLFLYPAVTPVRAAHQLITEIGCIEKPPTGAPALLTHSRHFGPQHTATCRINKKQTAWDGNNDENLLTSLQCVSVVLIIVVMGLPWNPTACAGKKKKCFNVGAEAKQFLICLYLGVHQHMAREWFTRLCCMLGPHTALSSLLLSLKSNLGFEEKYLADAEGANEDLSFTWFSLPYFLKCNPLASKVLYLKLGLVSYSKSIFYYICKKSPNILTAINKSNARPNKRKKHPVSACL